MTSTDYLISGGLVLAVVLQLRGRRLTPIGIAWPLALVVVAVVKYLHAIPTAGNDLGFTVVSMVVGLALGASAGLATSIRPGADGSAVARATPLAVVLWVVGIGLRMAFALYAQHGGGAAIAAWSRALDITSAQAWLAAFLLMALAEVAARTAVLAWRALVVRTHLAERAGA